MKRGRTHHIKGSPQSVFIGQGTALATGSGIDSDCFHLLDKEEISFISYYSILIILSSQVSCSKLLLFCHLISYYNLDQPSSGKIIALYKLNRIDLNLFTQFY